MARKLAPHPEYDQPTLSEEDGVRYLHFNSAWVQGAMSVKDPSALVLDYTEQLFSWLLFLKPQKNMGVLGLGAGALTRFAIKKMPSDVVTVEWNPRVTAICQSYFKLPNIKRLSIEHADAHEWVLNTANAHRCPILMVDLYDYTAQGPVCSDVSFYKGCRQVMGDLGVATFNLFGHHASFERNAKNLDKAFNNRVYYLPETPDGNRIAIALCGPPLSVSKEQFLTRATFITEHYGLPATQWADNLIKDYRFSEVLNF